MKIKEIRLLQEQWNVSEYQDLIDSGSAWLMEGSIGRRCMSYLKTGVCFLPNKVYYDYWGNEIPSRDKVASGTTGSLELSKDFWSDEEGYTEFFDLEQQLFI